MRNTLQKIRLSVLSLIFKYIITSEYAWKIFSQNDIPGFGTNLIRLYFPIYYDNVSDKESFSKEFSEIIAKKFDENALGYENVISKLIPYVNHVLTLPIKEKMPNPLYLDNYFFGILDASLLGYMLNTFKPAKIIEIGSGISTHYMKFFKDKFSLQTQILSIDPNPRSNIDLAANILIRESLEAVLEKESFDINPGDILFLDGSHYTFQGNDTLTFFFKLLPLIPQNVLIHIHDIYLPYDYSSNVSSQLWSEQYLLASLLYGGFEGYEVVFPTYYLSKSDESLTKLMEDSTKPLNKESFTKTSNHMYGYSFWFRKK